MNYVKLLATGVVCVGHICKRLGIDTREAFDFGCITYSLAPWRENPIHHEQNLTITFS